MPHCCCWLDAAYGPEAPPASVWLHHAAPPHLITPPHPMQATGSYLSRTLSYKDAEFALARVEMDPVFK